MVSLKTKIKKQKQKISRFDSKQQNSHKRQRAMHRERKKERLKLMLK